MKFVLSSLVLLASVGAMADQELRVVAADFSENLTCEKVMVDDGYKEPVMVQYTYCKDAAKVVEKLSSKYRVVLKVEGMDEFSKAILAKGKVQGVYLVEKLNIRITGVTE